MAIDIDYAWVLRGLPSIDSEAPVRHYPALPLSPREELGSPLRAALPSVRGMVSPGAEPWNRSDQKASCKRAQALMN